MEVRGLVDACLSLKMSKRTYTPEYEKKLRIMVRQFTKAENGFVIGFGNTPTDMRKDMRNLSRFWTRLLNMVLV